MGYKVIITLVLSLALLLPIVSAGDVDGGQDINPNGNDVPFSIISRDAPSMDSTPWSMTLNMDDDAYQNGTTFEIITQICLNSGVCDPPVIMNAEIDGPNQTIKLTPPSDHTYVNWRVKAIYEDGNSTNYPTGDWYKTWSSCWFDDGSYGGIDSNSDGCNSDDDSLPGFGILLSGTAIGIAAISFRKD